MSQTYTGSCQCGKVRYTAELELGEVIACNCSRCGRLGALFAFTPASQFALESGQDAVTSFEFNKHVITHYFCSTCGIQSYSMGRHPKTGVEMAAINVRCLEDVDVNALKVRHIDGKHL